jgi:hypothetical protein
MFARWRHGPSSFQRPAGIEKSPHRNIQFVMIAPNTTRDCRRVNNFQ